MEALKQSLRTYAESLRGQHATRIEIAIELERLAASISSADPRPAAQPGAVKALEWPALKTALWRVVMDAEINAHYIYAYDFTEKLYQAALAAPVSQEPGDPESDKRELGPDGREWAKTEAGYRHVEQVSARADGWHGMAPWFHGWAVREAFVTGAEWQEYRPAPTARITEGEPREAEVERVAARLWKAEAEDAGAPASVAQGRTRAAFDEQSDGTKDRWRKFARAALLAVKSKGGQADG